MKADDFASQSQSLLQKYALRLQRERHLVSICCNKSRLSLWFLKVVSLVSVNLITFRDVQSQPRWHSVCITRYLLRRTEHVLSYPNGLFDNGDDIAADWFQSCCSWQESFDFINRPLQSPTKCSKKEISARTNYHKCYSGYLHRKKMHNISNKETNKPVLNAC